MKTSLSLPVVLLYQGRTLDAVQVLDRERAVYAARPQAVLRTWLSQPDVVFLGTPSENYARAVHAGRVWTPA